MQENNNDQSISTTCPQIHPIVETMTNIMNYMAFSLYETQFTKNHEDSYATLQSIYNNIVSQPLAQPSYIDVKQFYDNIVFLGNVTYTDDPDYYKYKIILRKYFLDQQPIYKKHYQ